MTDAGVSLERVSESKAAAGTADLIGRRPSPSALRRRWAAVTGNSVVSTITIVFLVVIVAAAILAPWISPYPLDGTTGTNPGATLQPPGAAHPLGTDALGRDVLTRLIFGGRTSLLIVVGVLLLSATSGIVLGTVAGYLGGPVSSVIMRIADVFLAFPTLLLTVVLVTVLGAGLWTVVVAIAIAWWPWYARTASAMAQSVRRLGYVDAARCLGEGRASIVWRHVFPNILPPVIVQLSLDAGTIVLTVASLSFLGLGVKEPTSEWGLMIQQGQAHLSVEWWIAVFPGIAVLLTAFALNSLGETLRKKLVGFGA